MPVGYGAVSSPPGSVSLPGTVTLPASDGTTSTGPAATGAFEDLGAALSIPAGSFTQNGDVARVTFVAYRSAGAGLSALRVLVGGGDSGSFDDCNLVTGSAATVKIEVLLQRTASDTLTCTAQGIEDAGGPAANGDECRVGVVSISGLDFTAAISVQPQVKDSGSTAITTRQLVMVEMLRKGA